MIRIVIVAAWAALSCLTLAVPCTAQIPQEFTNLQVLPEDIEFRALVDTMRKFAGALGVRCNFCHVGGVGDSLEGVDFASDESHHKVAAREMMKLTNTINATVVEKVAEDEADAVRVTCTTCHRGQKRPFLTADVLNRAYEEGGVDAATSKYSELRDEYYGSHTYDFGEFVLTSMAEDLARAEKMEDAVAVLELNISFNPESSYSLGMLGQVKAQMGDTDGARAALEKALEIDPENGHIQRLLERLNQ